mmetsp:Transcript_8672/g.19079  ORF Transcript_8672/g.19079 Transcript_8672/m.19079 type:complete len:244 (+) Transcript_8672:1272-2003(+)
MRALSSSSGFRLQPLRRSSERPPSVTSCFWTSISLFCSSMAASVRFTSGPSSRPSCSAGLRIACFIVALSSSGSAEICRSRSAPLLAPISPRTDSFVTTFSRRFVSCMKPAGAFASSSSSSSSSSSPSFLVEAAMCATDLKMVSAILRIWSRRLSRGLSTIVEMDLDNTSEKDIMMIMTKISSRMFITEATWLGPRRLNSQMRLLVSNLTVLSGRFGTCRVGEAHGKAPAELLRPLSGFTEMV